MSFLLINPAVLPKLADECLQAAMPDLEVTDCRDDYSVSDGDGVWIRPFLEFIESEVANRCRLRNFQFSDDDRLDESQLEEIPIGHVRALLTQFINAEYEDFRSNAVTIPDYDEVRDDCRDFCDDCTCGWTTVNGEYDGPDADDIEDDEDENEAGISEKERRLRVDRNRVRAEERDRRRQAQEEAEEEIVDREFSCDSDCDAFIDHVDECVRDRIEVDTNGLNDRLSDYLKSSGYNVFPPIHPGCPDHPAA